MDMLARCNVGEPLTICVCLFFVCLSGEIETLQRCATLHSWNSHFWFSLALAYEKGSVSCIQPQDRDCNDFFRCKNCLLHEDLTEKNCIENSLNGKWQSKEVYFTIRPCCSSNNKVSGPICTKPCDSDELEIRQCLAHSDITKQEDLVNMKCSRSPCDIASDHRIGFQEHSDSICCSSKRCSEWLKDDGNSHLLSSNREHLPEHCGCAKDKLKWRNHVLAFGCLVKSRYVN